LPGSESLRLSASIVAFSDFKQKIQGGPALATQRVPVGSLKAAKRSSERSALSAHVWNDHFRWASAPSGITVSTYGNTPSTEESDAINNAIAIWGGGKFSRTSHGNGTISIFFGMSSWYGNCSNQPSTIPTPNAIWGCAPPWWWGTHCFKNETWYTITAGSILVLAYEDVITEEGADLEQRLTRMLTHELGHLLGLGHPDNDTTSHHDSETCDNTAPLAATNSFTIPVMASLPTACTSENSDCYYTSGYHLPDAVGHDELDAIAYLYSGSVGKTYSSCASPCGSCSETSIGTCP
jgi:hypothetical protein